MFIVTHPQIPQTHWWNLFPRQSSYSQVDGFYARILGGTVKPRSSTFCLITKKQTKRPTINVFHKDFSLQKQLSVIFLGESNPWVTAKFLCPVALQLHYDRVHTSHNRGDITSRHRGSSYISGKNSDSQDRGWDLGLVLFVFTRAYGLVCVLCMACWKHNRSRLMFSSLEQRGTFLFLMGSWENSLKYLEKVWRYSLSVGRM